MLNKLKSILLAFAGLLCLNAQAQIPAGDIAGVYVIDPGGSPTLELEICPGESLTLELEESFLLPSQLSGTGGGLLNYVGENQGHHYYKSNQGYTWDESESICQSHFGHLPAINSQQENSFIDANGAPDLWIGFTDAAQEGNFQWSSGDPVTFTNWAPGEPNNVGDEDYGVLRPDGFWNDAPGFLEYECWCEFESYPAQISWSTGGTGRSETFTPETSQWVVVEITRQDTTIIDSVFVELADMPDFDFETPSVFTCENSATIEGPENVGYDAYEWSNGSVEQIVQVSETGPLTLTRTIGGCVETNTIDVNIGGFELGPDTMYMCETGLFEPWITGLMGAWISSLQNAAFAGITIDGFNYEGVYEGHTYYSSNEQANVFDATSACNAIGGSLASLETAEENAYLNSLLPGETLWIGLNDVASEGNYVWPSGEPLSYTNWNDGEPNNLGNEDYVQTLSNGLWNDENGSSNYRYVCELNEAPVKIDIVGEPSVGLEPYSGFDFFPEMSVSGSGYVYVTLGNDDNSCTDSMYVSISELDVVANVLQNADCSNAQLGEVEINITGGVEPYTIEITDDENNIVSSDNLAAGIYNVYVLSAQQCSAETTFEIVDEQVCGCTNEAADNYNMNATYDDGSCIVSGCTDESACNYVAEATDDDGSCVYAEEYFDCDGVCVNDSDQDGICDELEVEGCTLEGAANYDPDATEDDGTCIIEGCTNSNADNYNPEATEDDGSCIIEGCTNSNADNYDPEATVNDGSCFITGADVIAEGDSLNVCAGNDAALTILSSLVLPQTLSSGQLTLVGSYGDNAYYISASEDYTWPEAEALCQLNDGHLPAVNSAQENTFIHNNGYDTQWIGLTDEANEGVFEWSSGDPFLVAAWFPGEPNNAGPDNSDENYVVMLPNGEWNDTYDESTAGCLCEYDPVPALISWSTGGTEPSEQFTPTENQWVNVEVVVDNVLYTDSIYVNVVDVDISLDAQVYECSSVYEITGPNPAEFDLYEWSNGSNEQTIEITESGDYTLNVEIDGCAFNATTSITIAGIQIDQDSALVCDQTDAMFSLIPYNYEVMAGAEIEGYEYQGFYNGHVYYSTLTELPAPDAQNACASLGGYLTAITDAGESDFVNSLFPGEVLYIGFSDNQSEGNFVWFNGDPITYTNWNDGEPNNAGDEDYTEILPNGSWNDVTGETPRNFVCEFDTPPITVEWSNGTEGESASFGTDSEGTIYVTVTNGFNTCVDSAEVVLTDLTINPLVIQPECFGDELGIATFEAVGGIEPYTLSTTAPDPSAITVGGYGAQVIDGMGCIDDTTFTIVMPDPIQSVAIGLEEDCSGLGRIVAEVQGGTAPYTFDWGGIDPDAVAAGQYSYSLTDASGCTTEGEVEVPEGSQCGCTYEGAENYDPGASVDDGSCIISGGAQCGPDTYFDEETGMCMPVVDPCPQDFNDDGLINSSDLLTFLGSFGTICQE